MRSLLLLLALSACATAANSGSSDDDGEGGTGAGATAADGGGGLGAGGSGSGGHPMGGAGGAGGTAGAGGIGAGGGELPVAWYRFEDVTGPVLDSSGNALDGTAMGAGITRGVSGKYGLAVSFNASDGYIVVPASALLDFVTAGTIELWVNLASTGSVGSTVSRGTGNNDDNVLMNSSCGNMQTIFSRTGVGTTNVTSSCSVIPVSVWTHIAVVNDGSQLRMYVNGALTTTAAGGFLGPLSTPLYIGRREQGIFPFHGSIDEIKWWTEVRTEAEICVDAGGTWTGSSCTL